MSLTHGGAASLLVHQTDALTALVSWLRRGRRRPQVHDQTWIPPALEAELLAKPEILTLDDPFWPLMTQGLEVWISGLSGLRSMGLVFSSQTLCPLLIFIACCNSLDCSAFLGEVVASRACREISESGNFEKS